MFFLIPIQYIDYIRRGTMSKLPALATSSLFILNCVNDCVIALRGIHNFTCDTGAALTNRVLKQFCFFLEKAVTKFR